MKKIILLNLVTEMVPYGVYDYRPPLLKSWTMATLPKEEERGMRGYEHPRPPSSVGTI